MIRNESRTYFFPQKFFMKNFKRIKKNWVNRSLYINTQIQQFFTFPFRVWLKGCGK